LFHPTQGNPHLRRKTISKLGGEEEREGIIMRFKIDNVRKRMDVSNDRRIQGLDIAGTT